MVCSNFYRNVVAFACGGAALTSLIALGLLSRDTIGKVTGQTRVLYSETGSPVTTTTTAVEGMHKRNIENFRGKVLLTRGKGYWLLLLLQLHSTLRTKVGEGGVLLNMEPLMSPTMVEVSNTTDTKKDKTILLHAKMGERRVTSHRYPDLVFCILYVVSCTQYTRHTGCLIHHLLSSSWSIRVSSRANDLHFSTRLFNFEFTHCCTLFRFRKTSHLYHFF